MRKLLFVILLCLSIFCSAYAEEMGGETCTPDSFFPDAGNCGYDVEHYVLDFTWNEQPNIWEGRETISLTSQWDMPELHLDFNSAYAIGELTVNGEAADFQSSGSDLIIDYDFAHDTAYWIYIHFAGELQRGTIFSSPGIIQREAGEPFCILAEPDIASNFFVCNNHMKDKASYDISVTVPASESAASNGRLIKIVEADGSITLPESSFTRPAPSADAEGMVTWHYAAEAEMAPYLFTLCTNPMEAQQKTLENGIVQLDFIDPLLKNQDKVREFAALQPEMIACFEQYLGPYPFKDSGSIAVSLSLGGAMETQTRSIYDVFSINESTFTHELSHQWMGDLVSISDWSELWIKEGFAVYAKALWEKCAGRPEDYQAEVYSDYYSVVNSDIIVFKAGEYADIYESYGFDLTKPLLEADAVRDKLEEFCQVRLTDTQKSEIDTLTADGTFTGEDFWNLVRKDCEKVIIDQDRIIKLGQFFGNEDDYIYFRGESGSGPMTIKADYDDMYSVRPYNGGALVYIMLHQELGDEVFKKALHLIIERHQNNVIDTQGFIDAFSEVAGRDLNELINTWLYYEQAPDLPGFYTYDEVRGSLMRTEF